MSIKILTKNAVENTNIDGARDCNFNAGRRSGIVKGALNQGNFFSSSSNTIALDTCELRLCGHRIVLDTVEYKTLSNIPSVPILYSMVAQVVVDDNNDVSFDLIIQSSSTPLVQENLDTTGKGKFQLEIGKFTQQTDGTITDIVRTADLITGGIGDSDGGQINIGNVTTNTLEPGMEAEVDVENRYDAEKKKTFTDFSFSIPEGRKGEKGDTGSQGEKGEKGDTGSQGEKGEKGDVGVTPNITAEAETLAAGSQATVTKSGTVENPNFKFGIPKGEKGDKGDKGETGESGLIYQATGQNTNGAMSQKATTDELKKNAYYLEITIENYKNVQFGDITTEQYMKLMSSSRPLLKLTETTNNLEIFLLPTITGFGQVNFTNSHYSLSFTYSEEKVYWRYSYYDEKQDTIDTIYPVGSIYLSVNKKSPASFIGRTWEELPANNALWTTATSSANAGTIIAAGLPNITGTVCGGDSDYRSGAFISSTQNGSKVGSGSAQFRTFTFDASHSNSVYGNSTTVQPPAYRIYAWKRKA